MGRCTFAVYLRRDFGILPIDIRIVKKSAEAQSEEGEEFIGIVEAKSYEDAILRIKSKLSQGLALGGKG